MSDQWQRRPTRPSDLLEPGACWQTGKRGGILGHLSGPISAHHGGGVAGQGPLSLGCSVRHRGAADAGFEMHTVAWRTATVFFAVIDLVAAVGLWLAAPWGAVVFAPSVVSMAVVEVFFPRVYGGSLYIVLAEVTLLGIYLWLAIYAAREQPP